MSAPAQPAASAAPAKGFKPYVRRRDHAWPSSPPRPSSPARIFGILFAASSVYLALKVGMTVSASIPIAVMSITLFRLFTRATILENNIVQTTGSAGESIAAGVVFTMPAILLMGWMTSAPCGCSPSPSWEACWACS